MLPMLGTKTMRVTQHCLDRRKKKNHLTEVGNILSFLMTYLFLCYVHLCLACICDGVRAPETGVTDSCELPCGCWELDPGPSGRAVSALNHRAISPVPLLKVLVVKKMLGPAQA